MLSTARKPSFLELLIPSSAPPHRRLGVRRLAGPNRRRSCDQDYGASSRYGDRSRDSGGSCTCESFLRVPLCRSGLDALRCISRLLRAAFALASARARSIALFLYF